jgi:hypothetical protein
MPPALRPIGLIRSANLATPLFAMALMVHVRKAHRRTTGRVVPAEAGVNRRRSGRSIRSSAGRRR